MKWNASAGASGRSLSTRVNRDTLCRALALLGSILHEGCLDTHARLIQPVVQWLDHAWYQKIGIVEQWHAFTFAEDLQPGQLSSYVCHSSSNPGLGQLCFTALSMLQILLDQVHLTCSHIDARQ